MGSRRSSQPRVNLAGGVSVTLGAHKRLERQATSEVPGTLRDALVFPAFVVWFIVCYVATKLVSELEWLGPVIGATSLVWYFVLPVGLGIVSWVWLGKPRQEKIALRTIELARERDAKLRSSRQFYSSPEWVELRRRVINEDGVVCRLCHEPINDPENLTVDHVKPRSRHPELALDRANLRVLCRPCNSRKGARMEW
jgi:hypothetical protein